LCLKLDNSIYSLLNITTSLKSQQLRSAFTGISRIGSNQLPYPPIADGVCFETGKQVLVSHKFLSSITELSGHEIKPLTAIDNTLDFETGSYYKLNTKSGITTILKGDNAGDIYMPFSELGLGAEFSLAPSDYKEIDKVEKFFTYLSSDITAYCVRTNYSNSETKDLLASVGIKPGWFEIKNGTKSNKFYMLHDGTIYPKYQVDAQRDYFNVKNFFKDGYTKDSVFKIDGKEYKLDDAGHLNIPEGTGCVWEKVKITK